MGIRLAQETSASEIEKSIKIWLQGAADRQGGRAERARHAAAKRHSTHHNRTVTITVVRVVQDHDHHSHGVTMRIINSASTLIIGIIHRAECDSAQFRYILLVADCYRVVHVWQLRLDHIRQ